MKEVTEFEWWLRTGRELASGEEQKFNPWHDPEDGRFTFSNQGKFFGARSSSADRAQMAKPPAPPPPAKKLGLAPSPSRQTQPTAVDARLACATTSRSTSFPSKASGISCTPIQNDF